VAHETGEGVTMLPGNEDTRAGYEAAVSLHTYEGSLTWTRFSALLIVNSIIMSVIAVTLASNHVLQWPVVAMSLAGFVTCVAWFLLTTRGFDYAKYWLLSAREIEEQYLTPGVNTLSRGAVFAKGCKVPLKLKCGPDHHQLSCLGRLLSFQCLANVVIFIFACIYVFLPLYAFFGDVGESGSGQVASHQHEHGRQHWR
jgi:hypothetical protein